MDNKMKYLFGTALWFIFIGVAHSEDVVVFIPGLGGWGEHEMFGLPYFGYDLAPLDWILPGRQRNYPRDMPSLVDLPTFVADVGPLSSAHDRACELYAMINGDVVDFGYFHAQEFNHDRYGRNFTNNGGYFREGRLGEVGSDGNINRVHLIAHSFGGNTARMLERLLHEGLPSEQAEYPAGEAPMSDLFASNQQPLDGGWIRSLVALATPFDGSTLHTRLGEVLTQKLESILFFFIAVAEFLGSDLDLVFDANLDHFGIHRFQGESCSEYWRRIFRSPFFDPNFRDSAEYDLSPKAQFDFNMAGRRTYPGTYYLAYATHQTDVVLGSSCSQRPGAGFDAVVNDDTEFFLKPTASLMGDLTDARVEDGGQCFEEEVFKACDPDLPVGGPWNDKGYQGWCPDNSYEWNDGLVSTRSSTGPEFGYPWDETRPRALGLEFQEGASCMAWEGMMDDRWYFVEIGVDHFQIVGWRTEYSLENVNYVYRQDIPHLINRIKTGGDPESYNCCVGQWCQQSTYDPPSPYPNGFEGG